MANPITRREFLQYSLATGAAVAASGALAADPQPTAGFTEVDELRVSVLADNYYDLFSPDSKYAKRFRTTAARNIHAEHGLSLFVETVVAGGTSACMFDFAVDPAGVASNMALLGLDVGKVSAFALSHGHWDHYASAVTLLGRSRERIAPGTPFFVGEEAFARHYSLRPGATEPTDLGALRRDEVEGAGVKVVEVNAPTQVIAGGYLTGNIERVTGYEKGAPTQFVRRGEKLERDVFPGEQGMFFLVKGKGLVVLSGCAHAGIVNTVLHAQKVTGSPRLHAVLGGTHLAGAKPEVLQATIRDLKALKPDLIVPAHCTSFDGIVAFAREMPNEFAVSTAGTRWTFKT